MYRLLPLRSMQHRSRLVLVVALLLTLRSAATLARGTPPAALGPLPATCPTNPPPTTINPFFGKGIGMQPVWVIGFSPGLTLRIDPAQGLLHGPHGWYVKLAWVVAPDYRRRVTLRGSALAGGPPLWFQIGGRPPTI